VTPILDPNLDLSPAWWALAILPVALVGALLVFLCGAPAQPRARHWTHWAFRATALAVLVAIVLNPVHVAVTPAPAHRPEVHVLLDASESMNRGKPESRWQEATALLRDALERQGGHADVRVHRFGERLAPVDLAALKPGGELAPPADSDSQLLSAFRQLSGRLGREAPAAVIVMSDGRVRDPGKLDEMTAPWKKSGVPVHVVPIGRAAEGGDVAIVAAVAPPKARKQAQVTVDVFLRSFGFAGQRVELHLQALGENGSVKRTLTTLPVTLRDGVQPVTVAFRMEPEFKRLRLHLPPPAGDIAASNNDFPLEVELDRTKIRVLLLDGSDAGGLARPNQRPADVEDDSDAPYAPFRDALLADPDVQCTVYHVTASGEPRRVLTRETAHLGPAFPKTAAELLAYDALVLSNVPRAALSDEVLGWVEEWIGKRGGGILMAGGPRAFGAGDWNGTAVERMLPVEFASAPDWDAAPAVPEPTGADLHPVWRLFEDERATRSALKALPESVGRNNWVRVKPQSGTTLGAQKAGAGAGSPLLAVGAYGRGRALALATPLSSAWAPQFTRAWGEAGDNRYFARLARNMIYWLTEDSAIGRRRLVASTDKRYYRPGETIALSAQTFDESATRTGRYRVEVLLEPKLFETKLPDCPVKWPVGRPRSPDSEPGPLVAWGEPITLIQDPQTKDYSLPLSLVEALANASAGQAFKLELTAYEGMTQIDSGSLDVQVLSDPHEQQNPLPDREFLSKLAQSTGGKEFTDAAALAEALKGLTVPGGPETVRRTPLWSREWLLGALIALLAAEWFVRRWRGLA
jgi:uncharacterized membrane protein